MNGTHLTPRQVAEKYQVSTTTVHAWIRSGQLRAIETTASSQRLRKTYRVSQAAIDQFEQARTVAPIPAQPQRIKRIDTGMKCSFGG